MERFHYSQRESILVGYNNNSSDNPQIQRPFTNPSTPNRNSDVDFNDVFGGPPRRSSVNEMRHSLSFSRLQDLDGEEEGEGPPEHEKPVFGEDNGIAGIRRRYPNKNNDFFDDIFGGEDSSPRMRDRVLSPAHRPLPSAVEHIGSLPSSFSLPAKMTKGVDLPTFGSPNWINRRSTLNDINDGTATSNRSASSDSHLSSRFSTQTVQRREEFKNDSKPSYRQSLLSQEFSNGTLSDKADKGSNMKQDPSVSEGFPSSSNTGHFHFSIYKWASKEVPLGMPLRTERNKRVKDKVKVERSSSAQELMIVSEITAQNDDGPIAAYNIASSLMKSGKQDHGSISCDARAESSSTHSLSEIGFYGKTEAPSQTHKLKSKPLRSLFNIESDEKQDFDEMTKREREEKNKTKNTKKSFAIFDVPVNPKKLEEKTVPLRKVSSQGSLGLGENVEKSRVKGKVKEFVRILNEEAVTKPRVIDSRSQGSTSYKQRGALRTKNEVEAYPDLSKKEFSAIKTTDTFSNNLSQQDDTSAPVPDISFSVMEDRDGSFNSNYTIQVLAENENEDLQRQDNQEIQVIDSKIQQWSKGKEGNIRSLLSTLQYVLWPECGWKPVPLVDIIEGNAVKRAYQRALLCLHPDKLQQKGAASHQKYIAEKVFDVLQEGWTQFNMLGAL